MEIGHQVYKIRAETWSVQQRVKRVGSKFVWREQVILSGTNSRSWAWVGGQAVVHSTRTLPRTSGGSLEQYWLSLFLWQDQARVWDVSTHQLHRRRLVTSQAWGWDFHKQSAGGELLMQEQIKCLVLVAVNTVRKTWLYYNLIARHTWGGGRGERKKSVLKTSQLKY